MRNRWHYKKIEILYLGKWYSHKRIQSTNFQSFQTLKTFKLSNRIAVSTQPTLPVSMSTKQQCTIIAAKAKATYANRNKRNAGSKPKPVFVTGNSVTTEPVKPKQQTQRRHRYTEEEWAEIRKRRSARRVEGRAHSSAQAEVADGGWATMAKGGKTRRVNKSEFGEIRTGLNDIAEANHQKQVAAEKATRPEVFEPISQPNKRGWAQVVYEPPSRHTKSQQAAQVVFSGKRISKSNTQPAVRKTRGWVGRVSKVASCSMYEAAAELDKAVADCNGRPGSARSQAILAAAANRAIGGEMPTLSATITNNAFEVLGDTEDPDTLFPVLQTKKSAPKKDQPKKVEPVKVELVDTTGMDEIDAALALIEAEKRNKIAKKVAKAKAKMEQDEKPVASVPKSKSKTKPAKESIGAWGTKSAWIKKADGKEVTTEKPVTIPRKVTFAEPACFTFDNDDIEGQDQEWEENVADREFDDSWFGSGDEEDIDPNTGYPAGMTDWGDQAMWDERH